MKYIKTYESKASESILLIVDVQKSFRKFFTEMYLNKLTKYCNQFSMVYQIWDNHIDGKNVDKDYLYDKDPEIPIHYDLYTFPNQKGLIEKRYNYNVNSSFYKKILSNDVYNSIKNKEDKNLLKKGDMFKTKKGTHIVYIGNNHKWYHLGKKLYDFFEKNRNKIIYIVGGSDGECLEDIFVVAESMGIEIKRDHRYIYSATHCPIK